MQQSLNKSLMEEANKELGGVRRYPSSPVALRQGQSTPNKDAGL